MNKRKIMSVICLAVATSYSITPAVSSYATTLNKAQVKVESRKAISNDKNKNEYKLENSKISFTNYWGANAGYITFNTTNMTFNVMQYNPKTWLGHNSNSYLTIKVSNPNTGYIYYKQSFTGESTSSDLVKFLNGKTFKYGDIITLEYSQNEGSIDILNNGEFIKNSSRECESFEITQNGLVNYKSNTKVNHLSNSKISFTNHWGANAGYITFNTTNMTFNVVEYNPKTWLGHNSNKYLNITVSNPNTGNICYEGSFTGESTSADLVKFLNNKTFEYGDIITLKYSKNEGSINILNNGASINSYGDFKITKQGLVPFKNNLKVNPLQILNGTKITSATVTGETAPNINVTATVNGEVFKGKSNSSGKFSIPISDKNGFTVQTSIKVSSINYCPIEITPKAQPNLGILKSQILIHGEDDVIAQDISFNPNTMTVSNIDPWGEQFSAQIIDKDTGEVVASCSTSNFNVFNSKNNLNGAKFKYGDIISIYETEETYLTIGRPQLIQDSKSTYLSTVKKFKSYEITPNGLIPVANKNLQITSDTYKGNQTVTLSGKTLPNTQVKIFLSKGVKTVESDNNGNFSVNVPLYETGIGQEIRFYVDNQNNENVVLGYDNNIFNINKNIIQILNNESVPVINIGFSPTNNTITATMYPIDKTYAGTFYGNHINIALINPSNGKIIKDITGSRPQEISSFINQINNQKYTSGEIIKVSYNNNFVTAKIYNDKKSIGNSDGKSEYFEITNKGLVNVNNKFINVNPINISNNKEFTVSGTSKPNSKINIEINNKNFITKTNAKGEFNTTISNVRSVNSTTPITLSSEGNINTVVYPILEENYNLKNSYINFYYNPNWEYSKIASSIGFNVSNNTFNVSNYVSSFGNGDSNYFTISLYNKSGNEIFNQSFKNGSTSNISDFLNNKKFNYGDIVGISFNNSISKPVILNGTNVLGNVNGNKEYFEITKNGLVSVSFGNKATGTNINWENNNLNISANLSMGISSDLLTANKSLVLINNDGKVIKSTNAKTTNNNGTYSVSGTFTEYELNNIKSGQYYTIGIDVNNTILPIYVNKVNTPSSSKYVLSQNGKNELSICTQGKQYVNIKTSDQIKNYLNTAQKNLNNIVNSNNNIDLNTNSNMKNQVYVTQFINAVGLSNLEKMYSASTQNANFINWVLNNNTAMQEFLNGPNPSGSSVIQEQQPATYSECVQVWANIWNAYTSSHTGFNLKLAIAVSLTNGKEMEAWPSSGTVGSPVQRYNIFETLSSTNKMLPEFYTLDVSHLCYVVDTIIPNDQIMKMRSIILQNHNGLVNDRDLNNIDSTINYNENNPHTGASVFGNNFYGPKPTIKDVWYDGGVCGAVSRMGVTGEQIFGIPAAQTPQPGHDAFIYDQNGQWIIGNDITGWKQDFGADLSGWSKNIATNPYVASYNILYQKADTYALKESNNYLLLSNSISGYSQKIEYIKKAIKIQPLNLGAWIDLVNLYKTTPIISINQYNELVQNIITEFKEYPQPMYDLLNQLKDVYIDNGNVSEFNNYVNSIKSALQSVKSGDVQPVAENLIKQMKSNGLIYNGITTSKI